MGEKKVSVQQYLIRREESVVRMNELADLAEKENKRAFTDKEREELSALEREKNVLDVRIASAEKTGYVTVTSREAAMDAYLREALKGKGVRNEVLYRESMKTTTANMDGMVPLTINDIVKPLEEGLILNKVGLPLMTGLAGDYCWPVVGAVEAEVAGEDVALSDKVIPLNKLKPTPQRVGITIKITNQTITQTEGVAYNVIVQQIAMALQRTLNKCMFTTETVSHKLVGPFNKIAQEGSVVALSTLKTKTARKAANYLAFAKSIPTYKELVAMKSLALLKGVDGTNMCYVMDEYTKGILESTDRGWDGTSEGQTGRMIVENGAIAGIPIFCTNYINDATNTFIGFGCWGYEPLGQFGEQRLVVDPYTEAKSDAVRVTLNGDWSMTSLREEAFVLGKCAAE